MAEHTRRKLKPEQQKHKQEERGKEGTERHRRAGQHQFKYKQTNSMPYVMFGTAREHGVCKRTRTGWVGGAECVPLGMHM